MRAYTVCPVVTVTPDSPGGRRSEWSELVPLVMGTPVAGGFPWPRGRQGKGGEEDSREEEREEEAGESGKAEGECYSSGSDNGGKEAVVSSSSGPVGSTNSVPEASTAQWPVLRIHRAVSFIHLASSQCDSPSTQKGVCTLLDQGSCNRTGSDVQFPQVHNHSHHPSRRHHRHPSPPLSMHTHGHATLFDDGVRHRRVHAGITVSSSPSRPATTPWDVPTSTSPVRCPREVDLPATGLRSSFSSCSSRRRSPSQHGSVPHRELNASAAAVSCSSSNSDLLLPPSLHPPVPASATLSTIPAHSPRRLHSVDYIAPPSRGRQAVTAARRCRSHVSRHSMDGLPALVGLPVAPSITALPLIITTGSDNRQRARQRQWRQQRQQQ